MAENSNSTAGTTAETSGAKSFSIKQIAVTVTLDGQKAKTFKNIACKVSIEKNGSPAFPKATIILKGLSTATMEELTCLAFGANKFRKNKVKVEAGVKDKSLSTVFQGDITTAWADFNSAPGVEFKIEAQSGAFPALIPHAPISIKGNQPVSEIFQSICTEIGATLENNDVTASIKNCILSGDPITKLRKIANQIGANFFFDDDKVVLVARNGTRKDQGEIPLINANNGMIGYPTFTNNGISLSAFFRPDLRIGARVKVESIVPRATGTWKITKLAHELCANDPKQNAWRTNIEAIYLS